LVKQPNSVGISPQKKKRSFEDANFPGGGPKLAKGAGIFVYEGHTGGGRFRRPRRGDFLVIDSRGSLHGWGGGSKGPDGGRWGNIFRVVGRGKQSGGKLNGDVMPKRGRAPAFEFLPLNGNPPCFSDRFRPKANWVK